MDLQTRKEKIKSFLPVKYFYEDSFDKNNRNKILADIKLKIVDSNNIFKCAPILKKEEEYHLFRKYSYLRYRLHKLTDVNIDRLKEKSVVEIENQIKKIQDLRNILIKCNTRLIVKPSTRYFEKESFNGDEFISNGYMHLMKAIEHFDFRRGFKFSTYCVWAIRSNIDRDMSNMFERKVSLYESLYQDEKMKFDPEDDHVEDFRETNEEYNKSFLDNVFSDFEANCQKNKLPAKRVNILKQLYGVGGYEKTTLVEVGKTLGLSKERVRQLREDTLRLLRKENYAYDPVV